MSAITVDGDLVHYEVLGRGRIVVLLHGWLGSWRYWIPMMRQLQLRYRVYAVDLFGYGDSSKNPRKYPIDQQVIMLDEFMRQLGITKAGVIAHGLGAHVLVEFGQKYPDRIARMLLTSAPIFNPGDLLTRVPAGQRVLLTPQGGSAAAPVAPPPPPKRDPSKPLASKTTGPADETIVRRPEGLERMLDPDATIPNANNMTISNANMLIDRAKLQEAALARGSAIMRGDDQLEKPQPPAAGDSANNPLKKALSGGMEALLAKCFRRSEPEFDRLASDLPRIDEKVLGYTTSRFDAGKMLDAMRTLSMPIVIAHGENDPVIPVPDEAVWDYLTIDREDTILPVPLPGVGHFPMMQSDSYTRLIGSFLETPDISKIELRERWRRRSR